MGEWNKDLKVSGTVVELGASDGGGFLRVFNNAEHGKSVSLNGEDGSVRAIDKAGRGVVMTSSLPALSVFDGKLNDFGLRQSLVTLSTESIGDETVGKIQISSDSQKSAVALGMTDTGGFITTQNRTGEPVCGMMVDEYGNGVVVAQDRNGKARTLKPGP